MKLDFFTERNEDIKTIYFNLYFLILAKELPQKQSWSPYICLLAAVLIKAASIKLKSAWGCLSLLLHYKMGKKNTGVESSICFSIS
jgi:hypothetical protein